MEDVKTDNIFGEVIPEEDMKVIEFVNERELFYESQAREKILTEVKEKFGDKGSTVLKQLSEDTHIDAEDLECSECGEVSKEWASAAQEKIKYIELFLDEEFEDVIMYIIENSSGSGTISEDLVREGITKHTKFDTIDKIPTDLFEKIKIKVLFTGISEGWLLDEMYTR